MTIVAHRIQLQPNNAQEAYFRQACGVKRFAWNWAVREWERQFRVIICRFSAKIAF